MLRDFLKAKPVGLFVMKQYLNDFTTEEELRSITDKILKTMYQVNKGDFTPFFDMEEQEGNKILVSIKREVPDFGRDTKFEHVGSLHIYKFINNKGWVSLHAHPRS